MALKNVSSTTTSAKSDSNYKRRLRKRTSEIKMRHGREIHIQYSKILKYKYAKTWHQVTTIKAPYIMERN